MLAFVLLIAKLCLTPTAALPVIVYHNITNSLQDYNNRDNALSITLDVFAQEMKYVQDNGFKMLV